MFLNNTYSQNRYALLSVHVFDKASLKSIQYCHPQIIKGYTNFTYHTDSLGIFTTKIASGPCTLKVQQVGYRDTLLKLNIINDTLVDLPLRTYSRMLHEITVNSVKPYIEQHLYKLIVNISNSIISQNGNSLEAIKSAPGVTLEKDGSINISGKETNILIDGRQIQLSPEQLNAYLTNLPAYDIERLEIITNPPAKYDAQAGSLINIVTKRRFFKGIKGAVQAQFEQGKCGRLDNGANVSLGAKRFTGNFLINYSNGVDRIKEDDYVNYKLPSSQWLISSESWNRKTSFLMKGSFEYRINKTNVISLQADDQNSKDTPSKRSISNIYDSNEIIDSTINSTSSRQVNRNQSSYNFNYRKKLDTLNREFQLNIDYLKYSSGSNQDLYSSEMQSLNFSGEHASQINSMQNINIASAKADFDLPIKNVDLSIGSKVSYNNTYDDFSSKKLLVIEPSVVPSEINSFKYKELIVAGYIMYSKTIKKLSFNTGIRVENTKMSSNSLLRDFSQSRSYAKAFPSLFLQYDVNLNHQFQLSGGTRINRPEYWRLDPFRNYSSAYYFIQGNPALVPSYITSLQGTYIYLHNYSFSIYCNFIQNSFVNLSSQNHGTKIYSEIQSNIPNSIARGVTTTFHYTIFGVVESSNFVRIQNTRIHFPYLDSTYTYNKTNLYVKTSNSISISRKNNIRAELSSWYSGSQNFGIFTQAARFDLSFGMQKTFWQNQGRVSVLFNDVFLKNGYKLDAAYKSVNSGFNSNSDSRSIRVTLSLILGDKKVKTLEKKETSNSE